MVFKKKLVERELMQSCFQYECDMSNPNVSKAVGALGRVAKFTWKPFSVAQKDGCHFNEGRGGRSSSRGISEVPSSLRRLDGSGQGEMGEDKQEWGAGDRQSPCDLLPVHGEETRQPFCEGGHRNKVSFPDAVSGGRASSAHPRRTWMHRQACTPHRLGSGSKHMKL